MTSTAISQHTYAPRRWSMRADLVFWTAAGAVVAALSHPLSVSWGIPRAVLLDGGLVFALLGPVLLLVLNRMRPTRQLVSGFVVTNAVLAPIALLAAGFGWLPLSTAGNWALVGAGIAMLVLGGWQFAAWRR